MKYLFLTSAALLAVLLLAAEQHRPATNGEGEGAPAREEQADSGTAAQPQPEPAGRDDWPRTFVPSEKINADSVVSFPADI